MRSSMKVLFAQDANVLSKKKYNSPFRNPVKTVQLLPLGNIGRSSNPGLGLVLPPPFNLSLVQDQGTTDFSVPLDVATRLSDLNECSSACCQALETPFLDPLHLDEDISPILPLPPSLDSVSSAVQRPNFQPPTVESAPLSGEVVTQDITSVVLNDDLFVREDVKTIPSSPVPSTPTVDIAEYGMSLCYRSETASADPKTGVINTTKFPNNRSPLLCDDIGLPILSAIPIYYGKSRDDNFSPSTPPSHDGARTRSLSSRAVVRSSVTCGHRRSHRIGQPIETSSPSMTPSPTHSPKLYRLPIYRGEGNCEAQSPKGLSLEPVVSITPTKISSLQSSFLCTQPPKRRSNMQELIWTNTRCSPWNSRLPLSLGCPFGALSPQMSRSDIATLHRPASIDV